MNIPTIVVGVDGDPASHAALRVAIDQATLRHGRVLAVACWSSEDHYLPHRSNGRDTDTCHKAEMLIAQTIAAVSANERERSMIVRESVEREPGSALVSASRAAALLVIGSTTRGPLLRHTGKAVVDHCLRFSDVPVVVVPYTLSELDEAEIELQLLSLMSDHHDDIPLRFDPYAMSDSTS